MENEKKYIYRIIAGIVLWFSNNEFTWNIINYFANINNTVNVQLISIFRTIVILISLVGLVVTMINSILLLKLSLFKKNG
jgi:hypothetical protein